MSHSQKVKVGSLLLLAVMSLGVFWLSPLSTLWTPGSGNAVQAASSLPYHEFADGPYTVRSNTILGADGKSYLFHGVGLDGLEFLCLPSEFNYSDPAHLAFMGPGTSGPNGTYWYANTVRLPLAESFWLNGFPVKGCTAAQYQGLVLQIVNNLTNLKLNVILDLQWSDAGGQSKGGGAAWQMPDNDSVAFWSQVAKVYSGYSNVLFELFNEAHPQGPPVPGNIWACWQLGCQITGDSSFETWCLCTENFNYQAVGMQTLVNTVRGAGANNLVLVAGTNWGFDLSQLANYPITGSNIVYDTHPYTYPGKNTPQNWDAAFGYLTKTVPVMSAEFGEYDCQTTFESQAVNYFDQHMMGWAAWAWFNTGNAADVCTYPELIQDNNGTPIPGMGAYIYQQLLNYAGIILSSPSPSPIPTLPPVTGPVSKVWYFAEGRAGAGFKEFLTLGNPTTNACQVTIQYLTQPDRGNGGTKTVPVSVPASRRVTEWVDGDLGTSPSGPGISDAAIVSVDTNATPNCNGIVAERPMYFNALGTNSGSDVVGVTHTGTTFYFADLPVGGQAGGGSYASFLPILNPGATSATVTATYYANGQQVGTQQVVVPAGARGTIFPSQANPSLPARVSVVLTATQPVVSERPTYFSNINGGNAGTVSGGADVVGVQSLASDWLFAEGYTGGQFQENFVLANLDPNNTQASVTINLEYDNGTTHAFQVLVNPLSQLIWNVNTNGTGSTSQSVSAEITSSGANIVVEREMFFKYNHVGNGRTLLATGGTDVIGQLGPAAISDYSFAEGYTNLGYDEWLTIQNPTAYTETINATMVNAVGTVYTFSAQVLGHSRYTVDIVAMVLQHLYHNGDGYNGFEVSMAVQSSNGAFVVERPMYWNASGTQGGSDVIGYS
ncbi:MAG TPA: cellulase family glycosylhydrolase [Anaerolineales bacterium]